MSGDRGAERPRGPSPNTVQLGRELYNLRLTHDERVDRLAERYGRSRSTAYRLIALERDNPAPAASAPTHNPDSASQPESQPLRPTQRTLLRRAWIAAHMDGRLRSLPADTWWFWLDVAVAVSTLGDGTTLLFRDSGFDGRTQFCTAHGANEAQLALLVRRQVVIDLDGIGVMLPVCIITGGRQ